MKPVIGWTLWLRRWSILGWSIGVGFFIFLNLIVYPSFKDQAAELQKTFENLPDTAVQLFGGSTDFFSPVGFLNSQVFFLMMPLLLGILAIALGSSLLAREEQDNTIAYLLARPISRAKLLTAKVAAGTAILIIVTVVSLIITLGMSKAESIGVPLSAMAIVTLFCFLLVLSFGAIAFLLTAVGRARSLSLGIAALIAIGGYLVSSLAGTVDWLKIPAKFFPFHYYRSEDILRGHTDWTNALVFIGITLVCGLLSWLAFRRRDLS